MLKVIIADDEAKVCQLILKLVDWNAFGMEIAAVVNDGKSALEAIREKQPDVVITDIRMPGYDGIELIEKGKELCHDAFFVIISGYSQFEYAKQAIKFGVENYLLKPLKKKELEATLGRILEKYREVNQAASEKEHLIERLQESEKKNKKNLIKELMDNGGSGPKRELAWINREYGCRFVNGLFVGVAVRPFLLQENGTECQVYELLLNKIIQILETRLTSLCEELVCAVRQDEVICILNMEQDRMLSVKKELGRLRMEIINWREIFARVEAVVGIGRIRTLPEELFAGIREAEAAILNRMALNDSGIIEYEGDGSGKTGSFTEEGACVMDGEIRGRVLSCFERLDSDGLIREIDLFKEECAAGGAGRDGKSDPDVGSRLYERYKGLVRLLLFGVGNFLPETEPVEEAFFARKYRAAFTLDEVYEWLKEYMKETFRLYFEKRRNTSIMPIRQAKQYIAENYNTNITLEDVSRLTGFNPAYFSSLFKKETGKNFTEYITEIRVGNAKELIVRSNRDIADIAAQVGYADLKYFSRVFKKATGVSPSEYRRLYG